MRYLLAIITIVLYSCIQNQSKKESALIKTEQQIGIEKISETINAASLFQKHGIQKGFFVISDLKNNSTKYYNDDLAKEAYPPMSTFKIPNTLIALESKAVKDEGEMIKWDKQVRQLSDWNRDHNLQSAYKYSVLWFYQELAKRTGKEKMHDYITKLNYGNKNVSGTIDQFWFDGSLKITADQQIDFLKRVYKGDLSVSVSSLNILKAIMATQSGDGYIISSKTGTGKLSESEYIGWYVGYIEKDTNTYFFASAVFGNNMPHLRKARLKIAEEILREQSTTPSLQINLP
jgi:beta-lactamase class D